MSLSPQDALIYLMVVTAGADRQISPNELARIRSLVERLPVFEGFALSELEGKANDCVALTNRNGDLELVLDEILSALPKRLHDTAYALAVEVAAVDLELEQEELRWLEMIRDRLAVDRLTTAAIERAAKARLRRARI